MPPTHSTYRHDRSVFYQKEERRLKEALRDCETFIIIGWSAGGTDDYYDSVFADFRKSSAGSRLYVIDKSPTGRRNSGLEKRLRKLFGRNATLVNVQMCGFSEEAVEKLKRSLQ